MALKEEDAGDSSTASPPNDSDKELEEAKNLDASIPTPGNGAQVTDWDGPNDPDNPQTWSASKKIYHILVPTILGFVV